MGNITFYFGSMYSGKSEKLIWKLKRYVLANKNVLLFKLNMDNRYSNNKVVTHTKDYSFPAVSITDSLDIMEAIYLKEKEDNIKIDVIGIDEIQFFSEDIKEVINQLISLGKDVIISGLDMFSNGEPFPLSAYYACTAKYVEKLHAVCVDCGKDSYLSYRLSNEHKTDKVIDIGSTGKYIALCENCVSKRNLE